MLDLNNVDISKLKQKSGNQLTITQNEDMSMIEEINFTSPIYINLHLINTDEGIKVTGYLKGEGLLQCSRCLEEFNWELRRKIKIHLSEKIENHEGSLQKKDLEKTVYSGNNIDLKEEIRQQIILSLPMKPICKEDCRGLCSNCGANLNKTICNCSN